MDFTLSPEIEDLRLRVRAFVDKEVLPLEADPANFSEHENIPRTGSSRCARRRGRPACGRRSRRRNIGGMELPIVAWAAIYEEAGALAVRPAGDQLHGARRRQHEPAGQGRHAASRRTSGSADRRRQGALVLRHDRAASRRRLRSGDDAHARREEGRQIHHQRPQMVHHRRRRRRAFHPHGAHLRRQAPAASPRSSFTRTSPAGASCAASRSWGRRSTAAIANWNSTASKCRQKTC